MMTLAVDQFTFKYHRACCAIPRFPPLKIFCAELHTIVIKAENDFVALQLGITEEGQLQCVVSHQGMLLHIEVSSFNPFIMDFSFQGRYFALYQNEPGAISDRLEFELNMGEKSVLFTSDEPPRVTSAHEGAQAVIYSFPHRESRR